MPQKVNQAVAAACPHHGLEVFQGACGSRGAQAAASEEGTPPAEGADVRHFYNEVWLPRMRDHLTLLQQQQQPQEGSDPEPGQQEQPDQVAAQRKNKKVHHCQSNCYRRAVLATTPAPVQKCACLQAHSGVGIYVQCACATQASRLPLKSLSAKDMNTRQPVHSRISIMR